MTEKMKNALPGGLAFPLFGVYLEWLLFFADGAGNPSALVLFRLALAGAAFGAFLWLLSRWLPNKKAARWVTGIGWFLAGVLVIANHCCHVFFGTYFQLSFMLSMSTQVAGGFFRETMTTILHNLWFFPLGFLPMILTIVFRKKLIPEGRDGGFVSIGVFALLTFCAVLLCHTGADGRYYTYAYSASDATPRFGLVNSLRLEGQYALFGQPAKKPAATVPTVPATSPTTVPGSPVESTAATEVPEATEPIVYGKNVTDIDFSSLSAGFEDMDAYFSSQEPTSQNAYTGLFAGKNLIFLTAEAFSTSVIDPVRTPTLYKLANNGFVFTNFYQPGWTQSTTGGEFANMTGIIPTWVNGTTAFQASIGDAMPLAMGWTFRSLGYRARAYHNNDYTYYNRDQTHPNLGYDYKGYGNGLNLDHVNWVPCSDLDMMENSVDEYISDYLETKIPFHTYYITVSGHAYYSFLYNDMAILHQEETADLPYSTTVRAYLAAQMELENALTYLMDRLDQAGILEDTVIVLAADHYPYGMTQDCPEDYYAEMTGIDDNENKTTRYRNTLILWSGDMPEPVVVEKPCSSIDIVPTLYNLFGISYDSRLLSGRDILDDSVAPGEVSTAMGIVVFPAYGGYGQSWVTNAGIYEASEGVFKPFEGVTVSEDYVSQVDALVEDRWYYARLLIQQNYYAHVFPDWEKPDIG